MLLDWKTLGETLFMIASAWLVGAGIAGPILFALFFMGGEYGEVFDWPGDGDGSRDESESVS